MRLELGYFARSLISGLNNGAANLRRSRCVGKFLLGSWLLMDDHVTAGFCLAGLADSDYHGNWALVGFEKVSPELKVHHLMQSSIKFSQCLKLL